MPSPRQGMEVLERIYIFKPMSNSRRPPSVNLCGIAARPKQDGLTLSRRSALIGSAAVLAACTEPKNPSMPRLVHHSLASLPTTTLPWLALRDHFIATVGANAGKGARMGPLLLLADATFAPRSRFPLHPHHEMEILSVVIEGSLSHHGDQAHGTTLGPRSRAAHLCT